jgi:hypothetical protein
MKIFEEESTWIMMSLGKVVQLCRVYKCDMLLLVPGMEPLSQHGKDLHETVKTDGNSFLKLKFTFSRNPFLKTCISLGIFDPRL